MKYYISQNKETVIGVDPAGQVYEFGALVNLDLQENAVQEPEPKKERISKKRKSPESDEEFSEAVMIDFFNTKSAKEIMELTGKTPTSIYNMKSRLKREGKLGKQEKKKSTYKPEAGKHPWKMGKPKKAVVFEPEHSPDDEDPFETGEAEESAPDDND